MAEILLGFAATLITQFAKKTKVPPLVCAAFLTYGIVFAWQVASLVAEGTFAVSDFASAFKTLASVGSIAWFASVGLFEIFKDSFEQAIPTKNIQS